MTNDEFEALFGAGKFVGALAGFLLILLGAIWLATVGTKKDAAGRRFRDMGAIGHRDFRQLCAVRRNHLFAQVDVVFRESRLRYCCLFSHHAPREKPPCEYLEYTADEGDTRFVDEVVNDYIGEGWFLDKMYLVKPEDPEAEQFKI